MSSVMTETFERLYDLSFELDSLIESLCSSKKRKLQLQKAGLNSVNLEDEIRRLNALINETKAKIKNLTLGQLNRLK